MQLHLDQFNETILEMIRCGTDHSNKFLLRCKSSYGIENNVDIPKILSGGLLGIGCRPVYATAPVNDVDAPRQYHGHFHPRCVTIAAIMLPDNEHI